MKSHRHTISAFVIIVIAAAVVAPAVTPAAPATSQPARRARAIFEVNDVPFAAKNGELDGDAVKDLLTGERVAIMLNDQFGTDVRPMLRGGLRSIDPRAVWLEVEVRVPDDSKLDANKVLAAWRNALRDALIATGKPELNRDDDMRQRLGTVIRETKDEMERLQRERSAARENTGVSDISREAVSRKLERLESMKQDLEISLQGKEARIKAVQEQIAKRGRGVAAASAGDASRVGDVAAKKAALNAEAAHMQADIAQLQAEATALAGTEGNDAKRNQIAASQDQRRARIAAIQAQIADLDASAASTRDPAVPSVDPTSDDLKKLLTEWSKTKEKLVKEKANYKFTSEAEGKAYEDKIRELENKMAWASDLLARRMTAESDATAGDAIAAELQKIVKAREEGLEKTRQLQERGRASPEEVTKAETALAEAKVQALSRQKTAAGTQSSVEMLTALNGELTTNSIDVAELRARYLFVVGELNKLQDRHVMEIADRVQNEIEPQIAALRARVQSLQSAADTIQQRQMNAAYPDVTLRDLKVTE